MSIDAKQSHTTIAVIERHSDGSYSLKALKQKLFVDGLSYLLQEVYGIENKINEINKVRLLTSDLKKKITKQPSCTTIYLAALYM